MNTPRSLIAVGIALIFARAISGPLCGIDSNLPPDLRTYYDRDGYAGEDGSMTEWNGRGKQFVAFFAANWRPLLRTWESRPPTPQQAALVRSAAEALPGHEYIEFLNSFLDHYENGRINGNVTMNAVTGMGDKMGFIATNFQHPDVQELVGRYRRLMASDPDQVRWCDSILKGDLRYQHQIFRGKSQPAPEILPPPHTSVPPTVDDASANSSPKPKNANEVKPPLSNVEPSSSKPWSVVAVFIVAAIGVLWLLLKNRK